MTLAAPRSETTARRRVLFCTIGSSPAVATETIWALCHQRSPAWVPDELHVVTTRDGLEKVVQGLHPEAPALAGLMPEGVPLPKTTIHVPSATGEALTLPLTDAKAMTLERVKALSRDATLLRDVATAKDNTAMGDLILGILWHFAARAEVELHVSLAGGRKTMSAHAQLAMSLVGRPGDEVTHVLVTPTALETCPTFWHKSQPTPATLQDGSVQDLDKAEITLVPCPTPWLRTLLPEADVARNLPPTLSGMVEQVNRATQVTKVIVDSSLNKLVLLDGSERVVTTVPMGAKAFAIYRLLAAARAEAWPASDGGEAGWITLDAFFPQNGDMRAWERMLNFLLEACRAEDRATSGGFRNQEELNRPYTPWLDIRDKMSGWPRQKEEGTAAQIAAARRANASDRARILDDVEAFFHSLTPVKKALKKVDPSLRAALLPENDRRKGKPVAYGLRLDPSRIVLR